MPPIIFTIQLNYYIIIRLSRHFIKGCDSTFHFMASQFPFEDDRGVPWGLQREACLQHSPFSAVCWVSASWRRRPSVAASWHSSNLMSGGGAEVILLRPRSQKNVAPHTYAFERRLHDEANRIPWWVLSYFL